MEIAIVGGGPAGLRAAEIAAEAGAGVTLYEAKASVGRKFLVAGRGGLNLTKAEPRTKFATRYHGPQQPPGIWETMLGQFDGEALRDWAAELGVETFVASTGRVYPRALKAAPLLRRWLQRLRSQGVRFAMHHRWTGVRPGAPVTLEFLVNGAPITAAADAVILAMGGGSWPETGSDGGWIQGLASAGVKTSPLEPANCGWELPWPEATLAVAEGQPLKSIVVRAGEEEVAGELLVTRYGLEGGALYQLGAVLRSQAQPEVRIDFKPTFTREQLVARMGPIRRNFLQEARQRWRLGDAAVAILAHLPGQGPYGSAQELAERVKNCVLPLTGPRPIAEAISSAGGVSWEGLDSGLMLRSVPGLFVAGEMIDWEAPTGGYLLTGCFASGTQAARSALSWLKSRDAFL